MVAIVADTHMPKGRRKLPDRCLELLGAAELIVHAGDFSGTGVLERFERLGPPLVAVHGNVDDAAVRRRLPELAEFKLGRHRIGVLHDAGPKAERLRRMRRRFPQLDALIFGHSHLPLHETGEDGFQIFNPGSPTERRRAPRHTMGLLEESGGALRFELIEL